MATLSGGQTPAPTAPRSGEPSSADHGDRIILPSLAWWSPAWVLLNRCRVAWG